MHAQALEGRICGVGECMRHTPIDVIRRLQEHAPVISFEIQLEVLAHGQGLIGFDGDTMSIFDDISEQRKCGGSFLNTCCTATCLLWHVASSQKDKFSR